jgi:autotransporter-associated beta strand protein
LKTAVTLTLSGTNTDTGNTIVNAGTLAFSGAGSIANSPVIHLNASTTLDVTGSAASTITLGDRPIFDGNIRPTPVNDFAPDTNFAGIRFDDAAGAFTLGGNRITLDGNIDFDANPGGPITQTINLDMLLSGTRTVSPQPNGAIISKGIISDGTGSF